MDALLESITHPDFARLLLAAGLDAALKGALLLALAGVLTALLRQASAATRHLVWCLALCSLLVLPVFSVLLPSWNVLRVPTLPFEIRVVEAPAPTEGGERSVAASELSVPEALSPGVASPDVPFLGAEGTGGTHGTPAAEPAGNVLPALLSLYDEVRRAHWTVWLLLIWASGAGFVLGRSLLGSFGVRRLARRATPIYDIEWLDLADELGDRLFLRRPVRLLRSAQAAMPMTWGTWRPVVLLPDTADAWAPVRRRCVLLHEFAHVKRRDTLTQALAQVACALFWFNPLAWVAARQMRTEREKACDDYVISGGARPSDYASHLLDIARSTRPTYVAPFTAVAMARPSQLEGRVLSILDPKRHRSTLGRLRMSLGLGLAAAVVLPLAALRFQAAPAEPPGSEATSIPTVSESSASSPNLSTSDLSTPDPFSSELTSVDPGETEPSGATGWATWTGTVAPDQQVEVRTLAGSITVEPVLGNQVEAVAHGAQAAARLRVASTPAGLLICTQDAIDADVCSHETWHVAPAPTTVTPVEVPLTVQVRVPHHVVVVARTRDGSVDATGLSGAVVAESSQGDLAIGTRGAVQAQAGGDVTLHLGATTWTGTSQVSAAGDVRVMLPEAADVDVTARSAGGVVTSNVPLGRDASGAYRARLGTGARSLAVQASDGVVQLVRLGTPDHGLALPAPPPSAAQQPSLSPPQPPVVSYSIERQTLARQTTETRYRVEQERTATLRRGARPEATPAHERVERDAREVQVRSEAAAQARLGQLLAESDVEVSDLHEALAAPRLRKWLEKAVGWAERHGVADLSAQAEAEAQRLGLSSEEPALVLLAQSLGLERAYVQAATRVGVAADPEAMLPLLAVGVDEAYLHALYRAGYRALCAEDVIRLHATGVEADYMLTLYRAGYEAWCPDEVIRLRESGVQATYALELARAGLKDLCAEELIRLRALDIDPAFVRWARAQQQTRLTPDLLVELKVRAAPAPPTSG